ncbi:NADH:ubiquinone oxidoreductase [Vibrio mexicanus]|uniref:NADH:ubiquinone oxidoreductase n=1 Tax=Vibrio mexicanus TaxID=1004326 RepID=UPI00063C02F7|nr:NADH:ubiquinone oxidoreductase [Vibrio mexicanus]
MKLIILSMMSVSGGILSADNFYSFLFGLAVSALAVGACYWFALRTTDYPHLALGLLVLGMVAKFAVAGFGVLFGVQTELICSPLVFTLSYLYFSIAMTYLWFSYRIKKIPLPHRERAMRLQTAD